MIGIYSSVEFALLFAIIYQLRMINFNINKQRLIYAWLYIIFLIYSRDIDIL